ncbi:MAG: endonuclease/exonuclease/phosphatase family protein [Desulfosarcina sp.]|nr:endonuclease/exonuclease/phosphatase family protein [Desulfosarcina sp.]
MALRIATYNIHRCVGCDGLEAPERIADVLRDINADVTALQEVAFDADGPKNILADLARSLNAQVIAGPTLLEQKGHYGNAVLSRIAPHSIDRLDISVPGREPRGVIAIKLRVNGSTVRIVATHLGLRPGERRYQMGRLLPLLEHPDAEVTILLGDFNEWFLWGRPLRWANRRFGSMPAPATFPSRRPLLALDRIWVDPADRLISLHRPRHAAAAVASDHLPLVAQVAI